MELVSRRRGNALILSVFLLLVLTSLGIVSMQRTRTDLIVSGNQAQADSTNAASQSGIAYGLYIAMNQLASIKSQVQNTGGVSQPVWLGGESTAIAAGAQQGPSVGVSQHLPIVVPTNTTYLPLAVMQQKFAFDVMALPLGRSIQVAGNGVDQFCSEIWDVDARGGIPVNPGDTLATTLGPSNDFYAYPANSNTLIVRNRARAIFGPTKCSTSGKY
jgi:hypothetical protein